jgi:hypothetical protein
MKIRRSIFWFVAIAAVLIAFMLWYGKKKPVEMPPMTSVETNVAPPAATVPSVPVSAPPAPVTNTAPTPLPSKWAQMQPILASGNDIPIVFYGRLEDQFGNPVSGAQIAASVRIYNGVQARVDNFSVTSDANGFFQINHGNGESLGLAPQKDGYVLASTGTFFKYSHLENQPYVPDQNNPTVIKMWKLQGAEPLFGINQRYKFRYTSEPINFDLLSGKIVPTGGDIRITVKRPAGDVSERTMQDWSVQMEVIGGGLIDSGGQEGVTYAAPESGYEPSETFTMSTSTHSWSGVFNRGFFIRSRNGQVYGKVTFGIGINQNPDDNVYVEFHGIANTNSSRNWEASIPQ